uniref:DNA repair protein RAD51-like protein n=1 Tax=Parasteatoda tepidariorum TaxID=114398 RepID=A0A2L2XVZ2_PARTP
MAVLVTSLCPLLSSSVLNLCHAAKIRTVIDFITSDPEELVQKIQLSYKDILSIRRSLIDKFSIFPQNAESLHLELLEMLSILDTGSKKLNNFLNGGIYSGEVTEIHGSAGSGKTQFCFSLVSKLIVEGKNSAIYLDTNNNFDGKRIEEIALRNTNNDRAVLQNLHLIKVKNIYDIYELFEFMDFIKEEIFKKENVFFHRLKLLVIDSITPLLSPLFGGKYLDGPALMNNVAQQFKVLTSQHMISILVCNNTVNDKDFAIKPALGHNWKYIPSISLSISKLSSGNHEMSTLKSCRNGLFPQVLFHITKAGVTD